MTQPAASEIGVGTVLQDTYELTSLLGKGGMGAVFLARHRRLPGRHVAVKFLLNSASQNPELYARFRREAEIASQLGHPNIVEVLDFDTLRDGTPFLVMEYLRGESLEQRLRRGRLPLAEALAITRQIGSALQAAHRAGVVHRDLKPANVFLVPTDSGGVVGERVKLLDFGISKMLDSQTLQTQDAVLIGTPQYMSPEQALGKNREVDARTDLFALGCIVYEMLSGTPPFAGEGGSIVQVVFRIVHTQPEPLASLCPDAPARVIAAVERALSKSPRDRHPDIASFISELTGSPLQSLSGAEIPSFSSSGGDVGATHVPSSTARFAAPSAAEEEAGFAATLVPSSTARIPAPAVEPLPASPAPTLRPQAVSAPPEVVPAVSPGALPARTVPKAGVVAGAGVLVLGLVAAGWWLGSRSAPAPASGAPVAVAVPSPGPQVLPAPVAAPPTLGVPPPPPPTTEPAPAVVEAPSAAPMATAAAERKPPSRQPARQEPSEAMPELVREDLREAERALAAGEFEEAIRLARRSQQKQVTQHAISIIAQAHCRQGDLSNARAQWRQLSSRAERIRVRRYCKQHNFDL